MNNKDKKADGFFSSPLSEYELLSPAGNMESLNAALYFGADSVYLGGSFLQLRAENASFSNEEIIKAVSLAHGKNKKLYVAVNSFSLNDEIEKVPDYAKFLYDADVDGVIVSDLGVLSEIKAAAPSLPVHISTQANIMNYKTALCYYNMGAERIIPARELTLEDIAEIRIKTPSKLKIECFVHGAMCMAYSGRCLLSSFLTGRSGNRGECTQPCRWIYNIEEKKRHGEKFNVIEEDGASAILSSHDLCAVGFLDDIAKAGASSFKIEGRMKSPYYVATVTNAYRKKMDGVGDDDYLKKELDSVSHRPYSSGFYYGYEKYNHHNDGKYRTARKFIGVVKGSVGKDSYLVEMRNRFSLGDTLEILSPHSVNESFKVESIKSLDGLEKLEAVIPREICVVKCEKKLFEGDILRA